ncbi:polysaccharide deacetylase family protein [Neobacillus dielmonensis]|uniref:polysaccharide deacetylase family protein n=1 Tax=Neobacillus dielmonensis TaxID=1347369 RepID=UPI0006943A5B|nr:polysaccharide deacetylase family protein [Neobacillus dielmonensis]
MKQLIIVFVTWLLLGISTTANASEKVPILVYHSIAEFTGHGQKELYVTPENFEMQMRYLRENGYTMLTFESWQETENVSKPIFVTFDDGYKNNLNVHQIFHKLKNDQFLPAATIFVISDFIGRNNRLSVRDLKMLANSGMFSIQSHTATHPDLTKAANLDDELKRSKLKIEQITGKPVIALAYPFGSYNNQIIHHTQKYYLYGLTTTPGPYIKSGLKDEYLQLPRTYIKYSTTLDQFKEIVQTK